MASKVSQELLGSIVAFEGRPDSISTQLRLLPTSPQVLILPSIQCQLTLGDLEHDFDARTYVRRVHDALVARNDTARAFLQGSTASNKRLVFMNGGTPSAQALCIRTIMKHETAGNETEATAIFDDLVRDGLTAHDARKTRVFASADERHAGLEDPITRAMRAADALDRQTASLQPSDDLDLTVLTRPRSSSLPLYGYSDAFGDAAPFFVFGVRPAADRESQVEEGPASPSYLTSATQFGQPAPKPTHLGPVLPPSTPHSPSCIGETYRPMPSPAAQDRAEPEPSSPASDAASIRTLDHVVYGEASLLDVRHSIVSRRGSLARVRSLDRICPARSKHRHLFISSESWLAEPETPLAHRPQSLMVVMDDRGAALNRLHSIEQPRTVIVKSKLPVVKVAPVPQAKKKRRRHKRHARARSTYVDRGTDAADVDLGPNTSFQPVFSCTEDLVVFFKEGSPDPVLESAINAFKDGRYPLPPRVSQEAGSGLRSPAPGTPSSQSPETPNDFATALEEPAVVCTSADADDYDPFAYMEANSSQPRKSSHMSSTVAMVRPPTPAQTPPPSVAVRDHEHNFHEFTIAPNQTAVAVQNSLRSILAEYFPPDTQGYHQFQFSLLPEFDGLWKPIFRATEAGSPQKGDGKVHQILAIGSQTGVKKEYSLAIAGQLERLGSKSSELGRADRVDFRYLLANAMQAFTAQPLANQTSDNPFTNSYLLATLIVPHLETYLALHPEVRYLLLQYPPEHLGTVLALQKLVGVDLMKVAQIVDSNSREHLPFTHIRGASIGSKSEATPAKRSSPSPRSSSDVPVSKANFLLTSTASDRDIAAFVSTVWNIPADFGDYDLQMSAPMASSSSSRKGKPPPPLLVRNDGLSPFPKISPQRPVSPKTVVPSSPPRLHASTPMIESIKTSRSAKSKRTHNNMTTTTMTANSSSSNNCNHNKSLNISQQQGDSASVMTSDPADDSDMDMEERRLMPLFLRKAGLRKPNSRKALKFLGLA